MTVSRTVSLSPITIDIMFFGVTEVLHVLVLSNDIH